MRTFCLNLTTSKGCLKVSTLGWAEVWVRGFVCLSLYVGECLNVKAESALKLVFNM